MAKVHKDVEFHVESKQSGGAKVFDNLADAAAHAFILAGSGHEKIVLDVCIWSAAGARAWGGEDGVEQFSDDPDASVFERFEITVNSRGRIP